MFLTNKLLIEQPCGEQQEADAATAVATNNSSPSQLAICCSDKLKFGRSSFLVTYS